MFQVNNVFVHSSTLDVVYKKIIFESESIFYERITSD